MLQKLSERRELAERLRALKSTHAVEITEELLRRNPTWLERFGEDARVKGIQDSAYHIDFLASAIQTGAPNAFSEYARWATRVLASRGMEPRLISESLRAIPDSLESELTEGQQRVVRSLIEQAAAECTEDAVQIVDPRERMNDLQSTYLHAMLSGDRRVARQIALDALDSGLELSDFYLDVLQECMYAVGELWETNQISVADEHLATAITQSVMAEVYQRIPWIEERKGRVVVTGVQSELHQIGAHLVADTLDLNGWDVMFLGTNLPNNDVFGMIEKHQADVLGVSTTMLLNTGHVIDMIDQARERFGDDLHIIVGGAAFRSRPDLWQEIGADGCGLNLREAVDQLEQIAG